MAERHGTRRGRRLRAWVGMAAGASALAATIVAAPAGAAEPIADLSVELTFAPATIVTGVETTFTLRAVNAGPDTAEDVAVGLRYDYQFYVPELPDNCRGGFDNPSVICTLGDVASGQSAAVEVTMLAGSSGVSTFTAIAGSPTADPDTSDRTVEETVLVRPGPSFGERYVAGTLPVVLERDASESDIDFWAPRAQDARFAGTFERIPYAWLSSNEYRRLRTREAYTRILGRSPGSDELSFWVGRLAGGMTFERVERSLIASGEFSALHPTDAIDAVHQAVLGRPAVPGVGPVASLADLAATLQRSGERQEQIITHLYEDTLGRQPSNFDRWVWFSHVRDGVSIERLWARMLSGYEWLRQFPLTQDDYPYWD